jgi:hypothetical protein
MILDLDRLKDIGVAAVAELNDNPEKCVSDIFHTAIGNLEAFLFLIERDVFIVDDELKERLDSISNELNTVALGLQHVNRGPLQ